MFSPNPNLVVPVNTVECMLREIRVRKQRLAKLDDDMRRWSEEAVAQGEIIRALQEYVSAQQIVYPEWKPK